MSSDKYLDEMREIQEKIINYLDENIRIEEYQDLNQMFDDIKIHDNNFKIKSVLNLILKIANNFHHQINFYDKIDQILRLIILDIKKYFSNFEIFHSCKSNKRILLFLIEEKIITIDENIAKKLVTEKYKNMKYHQYFSPEIRPFISTIKALQKEDKEEEDNENLFSDIEEEYDDNEEEGEGEDDDDWIEQLPEDFYDKRKIGENDDYICYLIQKNLIVEFIKYVNQTLYPLNSTIKPSIYETNSFLLKSKRTTLVEYTVFCGSKDIFNYLIQNKAEVTPSLWKYAIHGKNAEILVDILEQKWNYCYDFYDKMFLESIKCHHNEIADYFEANYLKSKDLREILHHSLKFYNFYFIQKNMVNERLMYYLCRYDYGFLVDIFKNRSSFHINENIIYKLFFEFYFNWQTFLMFKIKKLNDIQKIYNFYFIQNETF